MSLRTCRSIVRYHYIIIFTSYDNIDTKALCQKYENGKIIDLTAISTPVCCSQLITTLYKAQCFIYLQWIKNYNRESLISHT